MAICVKLNVLQRRKKENTVLGLKIREVFCNYENRTFILSEKNFCFKKPAKFVNQNDSEKLKEYQEQNLPSPSN